MAGGEGKQPLGAEFIHVQLDQSAHFQVVERHSSAPLPQNRSGQWLTLDVDRMELHVLPREPQYSCTSGIKRSTGCSQRGIEETWGFGPCPSESASYRSPNEARFDAQRRSEWTGRFSAGRISSRNFFSETKLHPGLDSARSKALRTRPRPDAPRRS